MSRVHTTIWSGPSTDLACPADAPPLADRSDEDVLAAHLTGDPRAFGELVQRHQLALWIVALRILGDPDDAQDAVQAALLRAFRFADTYRGESDVLAWLRTIAGNVSRRLARSRDRYGREVVGLPREELDAPGRARRATGPEERVLRVSEAARLLDQVDEPYRRTFILVKVQGFTYAEAAAMDDVAVGTVRSRIARAKAVLAAALRQ